MNASPAAVRAIVTRPAAEAAAWVGSLRAAGIDAVALPLLEIAPAADPAPIASAWQSLAEVDLLVFVSPNAVRGFFAARPGETAWPAATLAAAPGPGTAEALRAHGVAAALVVEPPAGAESFDSESLWAVLRERRGWNGARVLLVRGDGGREWLGEQLAAEGAAVSAVAAYSRRAPQLDVAGRGVLAAALRAPRRCVWLLSSSESVGHWQALVAEASSGEGAAAAAQARAIATHPRIAARAREAGFAEVTEALSSLPAVVACIQSLQP